MRESIKKEFDYEAMNILITHFFSNKNKGDAAINTVLISQLAKVYPKADIVISSSDSFTQDERFDDKQFVGSILHEALYVSANPVVRIILTIYTLIVSLIWVIAKRYFRVELNGIVSNRLRLFLVSLSMADIVVPTGGSYLMAKTTIQSNIVLLLQLWPILLAKVFNKKVHMYAQSVGPFDNWFARWLARYVLDSVELLYVREPISLTVLNDLGVRKPMVKMTADAAFLFSSKYKRQMKEYLKKKGVVDNKIKVGITVKRCYDDIRQKRYEKSIVDFAHYLINKYHAQVIFVAQCTSTLHNDDDRIVARRIVKSMGMPKDVFLLEDEFDHYHIKSLFENLDYLIATRLHSAIFALTGIVPTLAVAYEHKTVGTMKALGLAEWCVDVADVSQKVLMQKFELLFSQKTQYIEILKHSLLSYMKKARYEII